MIQELTTFLQHVLKGDLKPVYKLENLTMIQNEAVRLIQTRQWDQNDIMTAQVILEISNIIYNNTDAIVPIEDGIYDQLIVLYKMYDPTNYQVGGQPTQIDNSNRYAPAGDDVRLMSEPWQPIYFGDREAFEEGLFTENFMADPAYDPRLFRPIDRTVYNRNTRDMATIPHKYPKLAGTLDKCKFTLVKEAIEAGVIDDPSIVIFERDFLGKHVMQGIINPYEEITLLLELKYDGMAVEADVTDHILAARSRGDTNRDECEDLTPVLQNYPFFNAPELPNSEAFGMQFECIITKPNLRRLAELRGKAYKNNRNGVIGLMKSIDAYAYRDLITLVPLATSLDIDPISEVEFMNKYYTSGVGMKYAVVSGDYNTVLFQVYKFVKEAEAIRDIMPFMYDGVVVHYVDPRIRQCLGRVNHVNKYSIAIKFNPMVKEAIFLGYSYTVGQNGNITPMIHYTPVEFFGTVHNKSSGHSLQRFNELNLGIGDIINVTYVNDVMPYVTKPVMENTEFVRPSGVKEQFPTHCPCCGSELAFSETGKTARCLNLKCEARHVAMIAGMLDKLMFKGFAEESVIALGLKSMHDFLNMDYDRAVNCLGKANGEKFMTQLGLFKEQPIYDYILLGSMGFTGIAIETWKKILNHIHYFDIMSKPDNELEYMLRNVKGIGENKIRTILEERPMFDTDMLELVGINIVYTYKARQLPAIRFTGIRDQELETELRNRGYDANGKAGVTRSTAILVVPEIGWQSDKIKKCGPQTLIIPMDEFRKNLEIYLAQIRDM